MINGYKFRYIFLFLGLVFQLPVQAEDFYGKTAQKACNHMRDCARQNMGDIPPEYRDMIEMSLSSMCESLPVVDDIPQFGPQHPAYQPAVACMQSISNLTCQQIDENGADTAECRALSNMPATDNLVDYSESAEINENLDLTAENNTQAQAMASKLEHVMAGVEYLSAGEESYQRLDTSSLAVGDVVTLVDKYDASITKNAKVKQLMATAAILVILD